MAGHVDLKFDPVAASLPYVRSGQLKAYAVFGKSRWSAASEIPTADELGVPGQPVIAKLNAAVAEAFADPAVRRKITDFGAEIPPREQQTTEAFGVFHKAEIDKWWSFIKAAGIKAE